MGRRPSTDRSKRRKRPLPSLETRIDSPWDALLAVSVLGFAAAAAFAWLTPKPVVESVIATHRALTKAQAEADRVRIQAGVAEASAKGRTWKMPPERLGNRVMDDVGRVAERRNLQVANFASGRIVDGAGLRQVAFNVTLEGAFPDVLAAMADLERPEAKLAFGGVSVAPQGDAGGEPGRVSANLSMTAFILEDE